MLDGGCIKIRDMHVQKIMQPVGCFQRFLISRSRPSSVGVDIASVSSTFTYTTTWVNLWFSSRTTHRWDESSVWRQGLDAQKLDFVGKILVRNIQLHGVKDYDEHCKYLYEASHTYLHIPTMSSRMSQHLQWEDGAGLSYHGSQTYLKIEQMRYVENMR